MPWTIGRPGSPNPKVLQRPLREACAYCTSELGALQKASERLKKGAAVVKKLQARRHSALFSLFSLKDLLKISVRTAGPW